MPTLYGHAKILTKNAIESYDPEKGSLESHIMLNLQRLQRLAPQTGNILDISEGNRLLQREITNVEKELEDKLGRPPSDQEIADHLGISIKRIRSLRNIYGTVPESAFEGDVAVESLGQSPQSSNIKHKLWQEAVYQELSPIDQYIAETRLGLFGKKVLPIEMVAKKLKMSPAYVSQRAKAIAQKLVPPEVL